MSAKILLYALPITSIITYLLAVRRYPQDISKGLNFRLVILLQGFLSFNSLGDVDTTPNIPEKGSIR